MAIRIVVVFRLVDPAARIYLQVHHRGYLGCSANEDRVLGGSVAIAHGKRLGAAVEGKMPQHRRDSLHQRKLFDRFRVLQRKFLSIEYFRWEPAAYGRRNPLYEDQI